jgi:hypothetical protein
MKEGRNDIQVACSLSTTELWERGVELLGKFRSAVIATEELPDGYAFRVPGDGGCITLIAELMVAERECCPFLTFELTAQPNMGPVLVRVTGPAGAKGFLETILCNPKRAT